jgi:hypothetical protein
MSTSGEQAMSFSSKSVVLAALIDGQRKRLLNEAKWREGYRRLQVIDGKPVIPLTSFTSPLMFDGDGHTHGSPETMGAAAAFGASSGYNEPSTPDRKSAATQRLRKPGSSEPDDPANLGLWLFTVGVPDGRIYQYYPDGRPDTRIDPSARRKGTR